MVIKSTGKNPTLSQSFCTPTHLRIRLVSWPSLGEIQTSKVGVYWESESCDGDPRVKCFVPKLLLLNF